MSATGKVSMGKEAVEKDLAKKKKKGFRESLRRSLSLPVVPSNSRPKTSMFSSMSQVNNSSVSKVYHSNMLKQFREKQLLQAAMEKNPRNLLALLCPSTDKEIPVDVNCLNSNGENALLFAIGNKDHESFDVLMSRGCLVNQVSNSGVSLVHVAAAAGNHVILGKLLTKVKSEIITLKSYDGSTALHIGAGFASDKCVQMLLGRGIKINASNVHGLTPLAYSVSHEGTPSVVKLLLERGAKVNKKPRDGSSGIGVGRGREGAPSSSPSSTPLHLAAIRWKNRQSSEVIRVLVDFGAKLEGCKTCKTGIACKSVSQTVLDFVLSELKKKSGKSTSSSSSSSSPSSSSSQTLQITPTDVAAFVQAVKADNLRKMKQMCRKFRLDSVDNMPLSESMQQDGRTLLHLASAEGALQVVQYLIRRGADIDVKSTKGWSALHESCHEGHLAVTNLLLLKGANPTPMTEEGILPFHYFVSHNYTKKIDVNEMYIFHRVFEKLSGDGEFVNCQTKTRKESPLHYACLRMEAEENVKLLLQQKVLPDLRDKRGNTALHISIMNKRKNIVKLLLEAGADTTIVSPGGTCMELAKNDPELTSIITQSHQRKDRQKGIEDKVLTPFFNAMKNGDLEKVKEEIMKHEHLGLTIKDIPLPNNYGSDRRNWLHIVASEGHLEIVRFLLKQNLDVNARSTTGWTPLHEAANGGHLFICDELMQCGADPCLQTLEGNLALHYFVSRSYATLQHDFVSMYKFLRVFDRLTGQKTLLNAQTTTRNETPLHYACRKNDTKTNSLLLLKDGADPNITDKKGNTPLHISIQQKKLELVNVLLDFGADFNIPCGKFTCFELAKDSPAILTALEQAKTNAEAAAEEGAYDEEEEEEYDDEEVE